MRLFTQDGVAKDRRGQQYKTTQVPVMGLETAQGTHAKAWSCGAPPGQLWLPDQVDKQPCYPDVNAQEVSTPRGHLENLYKMTQAPAMGLEKSQAAMPLKHPGQTCYQDVYAGHVRTPRGHQSKMTQFSANVHDNSNGFYGHLSPDDRNINSVTMQKVPQQLPWTEKELARQRSLSAGRDGDPAWARIRTPSPIFCRLSQNEEQAGGATQPTQLVPLALNDYLFPSNRPRWADVRDEAEQANRNKIQEQPAPLAPAKERSIAAAKDEPKKQTVSRGSVGHPYACAEACKYAMKARGCKDGADCNRCHLCTWKKSDKKKGGNPTAQVNAEEDLSSN